MAKKNRVLVRTKFITESSFKISNYYKSSILHNFYTERVFDRINFNRKKNNKKLTRKSKGKS